MILLLALSLLFFSCSDLERPAQLERIATLQQTLDSLKIRLQEVNGAHAKEMLEAAYRVRFMIEAAEPESLEYEFAVRLDRFKQMAGDVEILRTYSEECLLRVHLLDQKLLKLKADIESGSGRRDRYDEYIMHETKQVKELEERVDDCVERWKEAEDVFDELNVILANEVPERVGR